jgi:hypothetical protein
MTNNHMTDKHNSPELWHPYHEPVIALHEVSQALAAYPSDNPHLVRPLAVIGS